MPVKRTVTTERRKGGGITGQTTPEGMIRHARRPMYGGVPAHFRIVYRESMTFLGRGAVCIPPDELRRGYGSIGLTDVADRLDVPNATLHADAFREWAGRTVQLLALVEETRTCPLIGDAMAGAFPSRPDVGELLVLGTGPLFHEHTAPDRMAYLNAMRFGVRFTVPYRYALDPDAVWRVVGQTVSVYVRDATRPAVQEVAELVPKKVPTSGDPRRAGRTLMNGFAVFSPAGVYVGDYTTVKAYELCREQWWKPVVRKAVKRRLS